MGSAECRTDLTHFLYPRIKYPILYFSNDLTSAYRVKWYHLMKEDEEDIALEEGEEEEDSDED